MYMVISNAISVKGLKVETYYLRAHPASMALAAMVIALVHLMYPETSNQIFVQSSFTEK